MIQVAYLVVGMGNSGWSVNESGELLSWCRVIER